MDGRDELARGTLLGRYVVLDILGRGGMGTVYAAFDPDLARRVAVKVLHRGAGDEQDRERLLGEAQAVARLAHPNVVAVHDVGTVDDRLFMAMELVAGTGLDVWIEKRRPWREVRDVFVQAGRGLAAAHAAAIVHRDFKPANVLIGEDGRVRVTDFSLARPIDDADADPDADPDQRPVTTIAGTPGYMSPEQIRGHHADARSDQFSFCVSLYEALFASRPFPAAANRPTTEGLGTTISGALAVLSSPPREPPADATAPAWLRRLVVRGLATRPDDRYPSMNELLRELERDTGAARRIGIAASLGAGVIAIAAAAAWPRAQAAAPPACRAVAEHRASAIDPARREAARAAILAGAPAVAAEWARVERRLDTWTGEWATMRSGACEATHVRHEQSAEQLDLRMHCLDQRLAKMRSTIDVLAAGEPAILASAVDVIEGVEGVDGCADVPALTAPVPPPADPALRARIIELSADHARAEADYNAGAYEQALAVATPTVEALRAVGHLPALADTLLLTGMIQVRAGQYEQAEPTLLEAAHVADAGRVDPLRVQAWTQLAFLVGYQREQPELGLIYADLARAAMNRAGVTPGDESAIELTIGDIEHARGNRDAAVIHLRRALAIREEALGPNAFGVGEALIELAGALEQPDEKIALLERALAIIEHDRGPMHPMIAIVLNNLGAAQYKLDRLPEALAYFERSLAAKEARLGKDHPSVAYAINNIATIEQDTGACATAVQGFERAAAIWTAAYGADHSTVGIALTGVGRCLVVLGEHARAVAPLERALILRELPGVEASERGEVRLYLGDALWHTPGEERDRARATALVREALAIFQKESLTADAAQAQAWLDR